MNLQNYYKKLIQSKEYKDFIKQYKDAYFCSGLFILDKESRGDEFHFDYYIPSSKKMFSFKFYGNQMQFLPIQNFETIIPEKITTDFNIELDDFEILILKRMEKEKMKEKIKKLLFSFQNLDGKKYFVVTIFLSGMGLLKVHIDIKEKKIVLFEKKSLLDMIKIFKKPRD